MLRFSVIHPMPNGDTFHFSSHHSEAGVRTRTLKYQLMLNKDMSWVPCYLKSEADKFIADLEESHKMEVEQLLMEIAELKKEKEMK